MSKQYGEKQDYRKIDLFFNGDYLSTTTWAKTCKQAVEKHIEGLETNSHRLGGLSNTEKYILKNKNLIKARYQK